MSNSASFRSSRIAILIVVYIAIFTDVTVYGVVLPILPAILVRAGVGQGADLDMYSSLLFGLYAVGLFFANPLFGALSDRYGNRTVPMLFGMLAMALTTILFASSTSLTLLIIARIAQASYN